MNDEYIYIKTNNVQTDMCEFVNQFGDEISYLSYPENIIKLKEGVTYRFTYTSIGVRTYYSYSEIYNFHLQRRTKHLKEKLKQKENIINRTKEFIQNKDVDVCTVRNNDIQDVKNIVLEILDNKGSDE